MQYITFLLVASALFVRGDMDEQDCKKKFTSPAPDDCTTFTGADGATDEVPCYVYTNGVPAALGDPPAK